MNVENETDREIDYEQTGDKNGMEVPGSNPGNEAALATDACAGKLSAKSKISFQPCGSPPWKVTFSMDGSVVAVTPPFSQPNAMVRFGTTVIL